MSLTVAKIAKMAFDGVSSAISDATHTASLEYDVQGAYNSTTGEHSLTPTSGGTGRALVDTVTPAADIFPDYTIGPGEELILLEGFTTIPKEAWRLTANSITWEIKRVQDILAASSLFYVVGLRT